MFMLRKLLLVIHFPARCSFFPPAAVAVASIMLATAAIRACVASTRETEGTACRAPRPITAAYVKRAPTLNHYVSFYVLTCVWLYLAVLYCVPLLKHAKVLERSDQLSSLELVLSLKLELLTSGTSSGNKRGRRVSNK